MNKEELREIQNIIEEITEILNSPMGMYNTWNSHDMRDIINKLDRCVREIEKIN
jgi:sugar-specific transcriptional regulator TrmB